jgi:hypothetical protein
VQLSAQPRRKLPCWLDVTVGHISGQYHALKWQTLLLQAHWAHPGAVSCKCYFPVSLSCCIVRTGCSVRECGCAVPVQLSSDRMPSIMQMSSFGGLLLKEVCMLLAVVIVCSDDVYQGRLVCDSWPQLPLCLRMFRRRVPTLSSTRSSSAALHWLACRASLCLWVLGVRLSGLCVRQYSLLAPAVHIGAVWFTMRVLHCCSTCITCILQ